MRRPCVILSCCVLAASASAATLSLTHPYGELVTRGEVTALITANEGRLACTPAARIERVGRTVSIDAYLMSDGAPVQTCAGGFSSIVIGELPEAGWWKVALRIHDANGIQPLESAMVEVQVTTAGSTCNKYPWPGSALNMIHRWLQPYEIIKRLEVDVAYRHRLGSPTGWREYAFPSLNYRYLSLSYPALANPYEIRAQLQQTGEFESVWVEGQLCFATPPGDAMGKVIEFYHAGLDHYFYSADVEEIRRLDDGTGAKGWARTGRSFTVVLMPGCIPAAPQQNAYRFYGRPGTGPDTHVFTVNREECRSVDDSGAWQFEGAPFWATPANAQGSCSTPGEIPLYRLWRPFGTSNHRFTTERGVAEEMVSRGWKDEGVAMCVRG